jgi:hypothetical protein
MGIKAIGSFKPFTGAFKVSEPPPPPPTVADWVTASINTTMHYAEQPTSVDVILPSANNAFVNDSNLTPTTYYAEQPTSVDVILPTANNVWITTTAV